ncbi:hypothetical protein DBV15_11814 [Temnothorax longispinosus]|uniref:Uncharacterized protein n=1 Tax=Temnothorax longispinosus TaxID=300112 RepID=A0A4S2KD89_9HYME|nr:hypothetical protein DBV15_11814 [Temnothorax longispinosus]
MEEPNVVSPPSSCFSGNMQRTFKKQRINPVEIAFHQMNNTLSNIAEMCSRKKPVNDNDPDVRLPESQPRAAQTEQAVAEPEPPQGNPAAAPAPREVALPNMPPTPLMSALQVPLLTPTPPPLIEAIAEIVGYDFPIGPVNQPSDDFETPSGESESDDETWRPR